MTHLRIVGSADLVPPPNVARASNADELLEQVKALARTPAVSPAEKERLRLQIRAKFFRWIVKFKWEAGVFDSARFKDDGHFEWYVGLILARTIYKAEAARAVHALIPRLDLKTISEACAFYASVFVPADDLLRMMRVAVSHSRCENKIDLDEFQVTEWLAAGQWAMGRCYGCERQNDDVARSSSAWPQVSQARGDELSRIPYNEYLKSPEWKGKRVFKLAFANNRCQICNKGAVALHVHHRTYERRGRELENDLIVLCADCHELFHKEARLVKD